MKTKYIDIRNHLGYVSLDAAIENLIALRHQYGGDAIIDVELDREPYACNDHATVTLLVKE